MFQENNVNLTDVVIIVNQVDNKHRVMHEFKGFNCKNRAILHEDYNQ